jgi:branched-chain amino acid transport system permease protein
MTGLAIFGVFFLMRSRLGLALRALGDDEIAASSTGVNLLLYKSIALMVSGFMASAMGAYYIQIVGTVNTTLFENLSFSLFPIFMVIIGGIRTFEGPIVGSIVFSLINYYVTGQFPGSTIDSLILSVTIIAVAVLLPRGLVPSLVSLRRHCRFRIT